MFKLINPVCLEKHTPGTINLPQRNARIGLVISGGILGGDSQLMQIIDALALLGLLFGSNNRRNVQRGQNRNDDNDNQQFHSCERRLH